jgi:hypothetical protein
MTKQAAYRRLYRLGADTARLAEARHGVHAAVYVVCSEMRQAFTPAAWSDGAFDVLVDMACGYDMRGDA